jgi:hypothetical protein
MGFTDNKIEIIMSSGAGYPVMMLTVYEFVPSNPEFLKLSYVRSSSRKDSQMFARSYAPPLGLYGAEVDHLRYICLDHIKSIISQDRDPGEFIWGDTSIISWKVFEAVNRYRKSSEKFENNVSCAAQA